MSFKKYNKPFNTIKTRLGYAMESSFVSTVVNSCFIENEYVPTNFDTMFLLYLSQYFTDYKLITTKDDDKENIEIDASIEYLEDNNLLDVLYSKCGEDYIEGLRRNAIELLEFEKSKRATPIADLISKVNSILDNMSKVIDIDSTEVKNLMNFAQNFNNISDKDKISSILDFHKEEEVK